MGRTGHHEDCGCSNLFLSLQSTDTIKPSPIQRKKGKRTLKVQKTVVALG